MPDGNSPGPLQAKSQPTFKPRVMAGSLVRVRSQLFLAPKAPLINQGILAQVGLQVGGRDGTETMSMNISKTGPFGGSTATPQPEGPMAICIMLTFGHILYCTPEKTFASHMGQPHNLFFEVMLLQYLLRWLQSSDAAKSITKEGAFKAEVALAASG